MSYILEALKQAQEHREGQQVPDLQSNHGPIADAAEEGSTTRRRHLVWYSALLASAIISGGVAGLWYGTVQEKLTTAIQPPAGFRPLVPATADDPEQLAKVGNTGIDTMQSLPGSSTRTDSVPITPAGPDTPPAPSMERFAVSSVATGDQLPSMPTTTANPDSAKLAAVEGADNQSRATEPIQETKTGLADRTDAVAVAVPEANNEATTPGSGLAAEMKPDSGPIPEAPAAPLTQPGSIESASASPAPTRQAVEEGTISESNLILNPSPEETEPVADYRTLPLDVQERIGEIGFSVHLYSPDPTRRMVKIDGIMRRQGSEVADGLVLDEITPTGAIFTYGDYRFKVPVR